jgi:hypothetical protein
MRILCKALLVAAALAALSITAAPPGGHPARAAVKQPAAAVQPRLSALMRDFGDRFVNAYFAAEGQNWALAQYQLGEMRAVARLAARVRPDSAERLDAFTTDYLAHLESAVMARDWSRFGDFFRKATQACNKCHVAMDRGFIKFERPPRPADDDINFMFPSDPVAAEPAK